MAERLNCKSKNQEILDDYLMYLRHLSVYEFALSYANTSHVIDLGCGTGYGTKWIAKKGDFTLGIDRAGYALPKQNLRDRKHSFCVADLCNLPIVDSYFDLAISFQVIEHIEKVHFYLTEASRILVPDGTFIVSTPNRNLRLWPLERPWNPYHVLEYSPTQLKNLLSKYFPYVNIFGLQVIQKINDYEKNRIRNARLWYLKHRMFNLIQKLPFGEIGISINRRAKQIFLTTESNKFETDVNKDNKSFKEIYSIRDFWVSDSQINKSIDLVAVCHKEF